MRFRIHDATPKDEPTVALNGQRIEMAKVCVGGEQGLLADFVRKTLVRWRLEGSIQVAMGSIESTDLSRWFEAYGPGLVLYARQWFASGSAEDVVQEVFVRLMSQRTAPSDVKAWLFRSVRNAAIGQLRSRRRRKTWEHRASADRAAWFEDRPDDLVDTSAAQAALVSLPDGQREVIVLRIWCGMTLQQIAEIVDRPVSTVFSRYKTGLDAVRRRLELSCKTKNS